jgi:hypothetical protein
MYSHREGIKYELRGILIGFYLFNLTLFLGSSSFYRFIDFYLLVFNLFIMANFFYTSLNSKVYVMIHLIISWNCTSNCLAKNNFNSRINEHFSQEYPKFWLTELFILVLISDFRFIGYEWEIFCSIHI